MSIEHVSDTARWVAVYRAMESERPDALFRDPWADRLAGAEGRAIVEALPRGRAMAWSMIVRTKVFDEMILNAVHEGGADLVLNLAAGLDTRPWRLELPAELAWVDVDHPGILEHKDGVMRAETPRCRYRALAADLTDPARRDEALAAATVGAKRGLVVSEGLLIYLEPDDVLALGRALHAAAPLKWWLTDLVSPQLLRMMSRWHGSGMSEEAAFRFAPAEGPAFFQAAGWREARWRPMWDEAKRLGRRMRGAWVWDLLGLLSSRRRREEVRRFSGSLLLERAAP